MHSADKRRSVRAADYERQVNEPYLVDKLLLKHVVVQCRTSLDDKRFNAVIADEQIHKFHDIDSAFAADDNIGAFCADCVNLLLRRLRAYRNYRLRIAAEDIGIERNIRSAVWDYTNRAFSFDSAHGQKRVVYLDGIGSDHDGIILGSCPVKKYLGRLIHVFHQDFAGRSFFKRQFAVGGYL